MATSHGKDGIVKVGANAVAETTQWTLTRTAETADDTAQGDSWRTHLAGLKGGTGSITCHWDPSDTNGQVALSVGESVSLSLYPSDDESGDAEITCTATVTSVGIQSSLEGVVSQSFDFLVNGAITDGTVS